MIFLAPEEYLAESGGLFRLLAGKRKYAVMSTRANEIKSKGGYRRSMKNCTHTIDYNEIHLVCLENL
jgi:hypothetical protein